MSEKKESLLDYKLNILIIGGGSSANRFVNSIVMFPNIHITLAGIREKSQTKFLAETYCLDFIMFDKINSFDNYDVLIFSVPYIIRMKLLKRIHNYEGLIVFEKPFAFNVQDYSLLCEMVKESNIVIPYTRRYDRMNDYHFEFKNDILDVSWPIVKIDNRSVYLDFLPHFVDWLQMEIIDFTFCSVKKHSDFFWDFNIDKYKIMIRYYSTSNYEKIMINKKQYNWPNYIVANQNMIISGINQNKNDKKGLLEQWLFDARLLEHLSS